MCGGTIEFKNGDTVGVCDSCGTKQTLPRLDDDRRASLYDRANHFRRNNEFDKAMGIYEQILSEDNSDAEAYWSLVLCRYGIEYVKDPATGKRVPTVNRAQYTSIFDDDNYKSALKYADAGQKAVYEEEANAINEIQKGILAISQKEEPFDVFICYKETDESGRRTQDSVLANDLYHQLKQEGFKVFFSRITLEDKIGTAYEPYIFAALNSAKVMVVIGTKPEYFNAVWVKNEWSRYLALIKGGAKKMLIPAYRDMDPYDLPEEFSHLQAQDMSKLGFMQDLIRGIKKLTGSSERNTVRETVTVQTADGNIKPLLKRAFMFLEDGEWNEADEYAEKVLDMDPECAEAYLCKLMAELKVKRRAELADCREPFDGNGNYEKACRFGNESIISELKGYIENIKIRNETAELEKLYREAVAAMNAAGSAKKCEAVAKLFGGISQYKDSEELKAQCLKKADDIKKEDIYNLALRQICGTIEGYECAIEQFKRIPGFKDADKKIIECREEIAKIKRREEAKRIEAERIAKRIAERNKRILSNTVRIIAGLIAIVIFVNACIFFANTVSQPRIRTNNFRKGNFDIGDTVVFGDYHGEIEWLVLDKKDGNALLISKYCLDAEPYNKEYESVTWETCTLRKWLNDEFINETFTEEEKVLICDTYLQNPDNPECGTDGGNDTTDKMFLLSIDEANNYFSNDEARAATATGYARKQGIYVSKENGTNGNTWWWLRSPGGGSNRAACVSSVGAVLYNGGNVSRGNVSRGNSGVRPAFWANVGE